MTLTLLVQAWVQEMFSDVPTGKGPRPTFEDMPQPFQVCSNH
jgi:hypothetical protein